MVTKSAIFVKELFRAQLPEYYCYHNAQHTIEVVDMALHIGGASGLTSEQLEIIAVAAWFHDAGYVKAYSGHEEASVAIASDFLRDAGYPDDKILQVAACIRATAVPQRPQNALESALCDADLANIGTSDFFPKSAALRAEQESYLQKRFSDEEWQRKTLDFCKRHRFHTPYAQQNFEATLAANVATLEKALSLQHS